MSDQRVVCDKCGTEYGIGDSPVCKGGHGPVSREAKIRFARFATGGYVNQHCAQPHKWTPGHKGVLITSPEHERQVFKENNIEMAGHYGAGVDRRDAIDRGEHR